tara:strand:- start:271 stop:471 length:201 start_codon:yes stop_codon:yes gene_type:complete
MEIKKMDKEKNGIPGWLQTHEASHILGLTDSQFRRQQSKFKSIQLHKNGPRFYEEGEILKYKNENG